MKRRFFIGLAIIGGLLFGGGLWLQAAVLPVAPDSAAKQIFVVRKGEGLREIAARLKEAKLIRSPLAFFLIVRQKKLARQLQAGDFELSPALSAQQIAAELTHGTVDVWVTIPEGWRNAQIASALKKQLAINEEDFLSAAKEGYMFPDTYLIPKHASAAAIVRMLENNFTNKVNNGAAKIIIMASIVEREAKHDSDRSLIAGVLWNRLNLGMPLQADATLQYIKGYDKKTGTWWPPITAADKLLVSPYNTYQNKGLPPTPISNPGLASIKAAAAPADTEYLYYLSDRDGRMHYAKTLREHNENIRRYLK